MTRAEALIHALLALFVIAIAASQVRADDLTDFEAARTRYDRHEYARAADTFHKLVGTDPPRISNALLVLESRKYYGASLLFLGKKEEARAQFRRLLEQEPGYALDPLAFPTEVVAVFEEVKVGVRRQLEKKLAEEAALRAESERLLQAAEELRQQNLARLRGMAEEEVEVTRNSRWIATVPFGVGQFQNGHKGLGVALAVAEGFTAVTSVITFIGHQQVADDKPTFSELDETNRIKRAWFTANVASFTTFAAIALIGIIDAHVRFVPGRVKATPRSLPPDLDRWVREQGRAMGPVLRF